MKILKWRNDYQETLLSAIWTYVIRVKITPYFLFDDQ